MTTTLDAAQRARIGTLRPLMQMIATATRREQAKREAAVRSGLSPKRVETLYLAWRRQGDDALVEKRKLPRAKKSAAETFPISPEEQAKLRQLVLKCDSIPVAIEALAEWEECSDALRFIIARHRHNRNYPKALRRAARTSDHDRDLTRGPKRFRLQAYTQLRENTYIDAAGNEHPLRGGDLFECDDMSVNQPFWYEWPYGGDKLSNNFGVRLGRQMLACRDVATGKWVGFDLVGRVRDAYRAEDVMRFLGRIGDLVGLPRLGFRLEHGVWAARSVRGVKETRDEEEKQNYGSIRDVVDIHYANTSKGKGALEGSFDFLQTLLALDGLQIGRVRGEYEKATALARQCAEGIIHPRDAGFPHITEIADRIEKAMATADARPKAGRLIRGISASLWEADMSTAPLAIIPTASRHLFLPVKQLRPIQGGHVRYKVPHYDHLFSFAVPDELAVLGNGYRLLVCFDPADPATGATVFDAETDGRRHYHHTEGQALGIFPFAPNAPQLDLTGRANFSTKRDYLAAARTVFRTTGMRQGTGASIDQMADGRGSSARIERGSAPLVPEPGNRAEEALQARRDHASRHDRAAARQLRHVSTDVFLDDEDDATSDDFSGATSRITADALLDD